MSLVYSALLQELFTVIEEQKRASAIQYGFEKWETRALMLSKTPAHGNTTNEKIWR